jgi:hypothetical protein
MLQPEMVNLTKCDGPKDAMTQVQVQVPKDKIIVSMLFKNIISDLGEHDVIFPCQFNDVFSDYVLYLTSNLVNDNVDNIKRCLQLCHYLDDDEYIEALVHQLSCHWASLDNNHNKDQDIKPWISYTNDLTDELKLEIYSRYPYYFLPEWYVLDHKLFKQWLYMNKGRHFSFKGRQQYYCNITTGNDDKVSSINPHYIDETGKLWTNHGVVRSWDENGNLTQSIRYYRNDKNGLCKKLTYNGLFESHYKSNIKHGDIKKYNLSGKPEYEHHYQDGLKNGLQVGYAYGGTKILYRCFYSYGKRLTAYTYDKNGKIVRSDDDVQEYSD